MSTEKTIIETDFRRLLADTLTPVGLYLRLRDRYREALLLESSDYHARDNSFSFICLEPLASAEASEGKFRSGTGHLGEAKAIPPAGLPDLLAAFMDSFEVDAEGPARRFNGFFGYTSFDAVQYAETIRFNPQKKPLGYPDLRYSLYRFVIAINHFKEELFLIENRLPGETSRLDQLETVVRARSFGSFRFSAQGAETANMTDENYLDMVREGKQHCQIGDVFQVVVARSFAQAFQGDEFNVYRALRSINPSPYLFYFDYGGFRLFGSSPEAQLVSNGKRARIHPIAGTYRRTGDDAHDAEAARALAADPKENAEHVMLVDLARNDLGRNANKVEVTQLREIQFFSHVIHLVSTVEGDLPPDTNPVKLLMDSFPAGTLSGAPKFRAMEIIDGLEPTRRGFYGGALGMYGLDGEVNHAIMIRSFCSKDNQLFFQAGAGVVLASDPESELAEVANKLAALRRAIQLAEDI